MRREAASACWFLLVAVAACNKMEEAECQGLRAQAFEVINGAHVCADDADCVPTTWPGCSKPVNSKNLARVTELKDKFDKGKCVEEKGNCRDTPEVYCKQGLCTFREVAGGPTNKPK
jgi:hypothetical protein